MGRQSSPTYPTWIPYSPLSQPRAPQPRSCVYLCHKGWVQLLILWNSFLAFPGYDWGIKTKEEAPQKAEVSHLDLKKNTHPTKQVLHKLLQHLVLCLARSKDSFNIEWMNEWICAFHVSLTSANVIMSFDHLVCYTSIYALQPPKILRQKKLLFWNAMFTVVIIRFDIDPFCYWHCTSQDH